jgi:hypothetical protein
MHPDNLRDLIDGIADFNKAVQSLREYLVVLQDAMGGDMDADYLRVLDAKLGETQELSAAVVTELAKRTPESA